MDRLNGIIAGYKERANQFGEKLLQLKEVLDEIERAIGQKPNGAQTLEFLKMLGTPEKFLIQASLHVTKDPSLRNVEAFYDFTRVSLKNSFFNLECLKESQRFIDELNDIIRSVVDHFFKVLNESTDEQRHYKAICLRRDIRRAEILTEGYSLTPIIDSVDWSQLVPCKEYIEWEVNLDFLNEVYGQESKSFEDAKSWWRITDLIYTSRMAINSRVMILERLAEFNIDMPEDA